MDITDQAAVEKELGRYRPDVVIHCAAYTNVDGAEDKPEHAYRINALGTQNMAMACQQIGASMVYISTDYVFDGKMGRPYDEYDIPFPLSAYGRSKVAGESLARQHVDRLFIVRSSWLFGDGNNFVRTILRAGYQHQLVRVVNDQSGCPTYAADLAEAIAKLIATKRYGVYHVVNSGITTWYDFACQIFSVCGKGVRVEPLSTAEFGRPAPRPAFSALNDNLFRLVTGHVMRPWQEALQDFIETDPVIKAIRSEEK
jgi:dTDP-4-dehydrorhamnose reductase